MYDFDQRLAQIKEKETNLREEKKAQKRAEKEKARLELVQEAVHDPANDEMAKLMGFSGGFGTTKKK